MCNIFKNVICLFVINAFVLILNELASYLVVFIFMLCKFFENTTYEKIIINLVFIIFLLIWFVKYFILPISYKKLENSNYFDLMSKFIKKLKQSWCFKIVVLIIAYLISWITGYVSFEDKFYIQLFNAMRSGLFGCYILLFIYWFIENKIRNAKEKTL